MTHTSRRSFLRLSTLTAAFSTVGAGPLISGSYAAAYQPREHHRRLKLALASYTTRKFTLEQTLEMCRRIGLKAICLKSFHLPLSASEAQIAAAKAKVATAGLHLYGGGVISMKDEKEVTQAFAYARAAGMSRMIIAPKPALLKLIESHVKQTGIAVAIHNHGPTDKQFPTPLEAYALIKDLDKRVGICHDIGHTTRVGQDPAEITRRCADRILDVHFKDVTATNAKGHAIACGRGVIDLPAVLRTLLDVGYQGYVAFEYEADPSDPLPGLAESVGYVRGALDAIG